MTRFPGKKVKCNSSKKDMIAAISAVKFRKMNLRQASELFDVPYKTLKGKIKRQNYKIKIPAPRLFEDKQIEFDDLSDDAILHIFRFAFLDKDPYRLSRVCSRWKYLSETKNLWKDVKLNYDRHCDTKDWDNFLNNLKTAPVLRNLSLFYLTRDLTATVSSVISTGSLCCLRKLSITGSDITEKDLSTIIRTAGKNIERLELTRNRIIQGYIDESSIANGSVEWDVPKLKSLCTDLRTFQNGPFRELAFNWSSLEEIELNLNSTDTLIIPEKHQLVSRTGHQIKRFFLHSNWLLGEDGNINLSFIRSKIPNLEILSLTELIYNQKELSRNKIEINWKAQRSNNYLEIRIDDTIVGSLNIWSSFDLKISNTFWWIDEMVFHVQLKSVDCAFKIISACPQIKKCTLIENCHAGKPSIWCKYSFFKIQKQFDSRVIDNLEFLRRIDICGCSVFTNYGRNNLREPPHIFTTLNSK